MFDVDFLGLPFRLCPALHGVDALAGLVEHHPRLGQAGAGLGELVGAALGVLAGLLGLVTSYEKRKFHLGYRLATLRQPMLGFGAGDRLRGHEFHYSTILEQPDAPLAEVVDADGNAVPETGSWRGRVTGTFFHHIAEATP